MIGTRSSVSPRFDLCAMVAVVTAWLLTAGMAHAMPLYASREGTKCASCHFDPNGGGMRNEFGFTYLKNRHSMEEETKFGAVDVDPQLNDWIRFGADVRTMYLVEGSDNSYRASFYPMQGNLRVAITPHEHLTVVGSHGLTVDNSYPTMYLARELYAMIHGLPKDAFIQVGRFRVPFGLRQDDHTSFTRQTLPYDQQKEDAGVAIGSVGKNGWFEFSYTNGEAEHPATDGAQAFAGKIAWAFPWLQGGISGYTDMNGADSDRWSLYLTRTFGRLTLLGEYVGGTDDARTIKNNMAAFAEADYRLSRGVNLRGKFDYYDSDRNSSTNTTQKRYLIDLDIAPVPFTEVKLSARRYDDSGTYNEYLAMLYVPF